MKRKLQLVPKISNFDQSVKISKWLVKAGDKVEIGVPLVEIETSKANVEITSEYEGQVYFLLKEGQFIKVDEPLVSYDLPLTDIDFSEVKRMQSVRLSDNAKKLLEMKPELHEKLKNFAGLVTAQDLISDHGKLAEIDFMQGARSSITSSLSIKLDAHFLTESIEQHSLMKGWSLPIIAISFALALRVVDESVSSISLAVDRGSFVNLISVPVRDFETFVLNARIRIQSLKRKSVRPEWMIPQKFAISDMSEFEIDSFVPVLGRGQTAILGVAFSGKNSNRQYSFTLVFDHKKWTGSQAARVLGKLKEILSLIKSSEDLDRIL